MRESKGRVTGCGDDLCQSSPATHSAGARSRRLALALKSFACRSLLGSPLSSLAGLACVAKTTGFCGPKRHTRHGHVPSASQARAGHIMRRWAPASSSALSATLALVRFLFVRGLELLLFAGCPASSVESRADRWAIIQDEDDEEAAQGVQAADAQQKTSERDRSARSSCRVAAQDRLETDSSGSRPIAVRCPPDLPSRSARQARPIIYCYVVLTSFRGSSISAKL